MTFEEYVRLRGPALVRLARLLAHDRHAGDDLAQEVLARAYVHWGRIIRDGDPDAYLRRMLVNAHISQWRRHRSRVLVGGKAGGVVDEPAAGWDIAHATAERDALWRLVVDLSPRQRATIVLRYYEDLDDDAIAAILDCSPATVRTHAMRALATLRSRLAAPSRSTA